MSLDLILITLGVFLLFVLLHIILQRTLKTRKLIQLLLLNFIVLPVILLICLVIININLNLFNTITIIASILMFLSLSSAYIQTYPAIETFAPTLRIIYELGKSSKEGLTFEEITLKFPPESIVEDSIDHLLAEGFIIIEKDCFKITSKGMKMAVLFSILRQLYRLEKGCG